MMASSSAVAAVRGPAAASHAAVRKPQHRLSTRAMTGAGFPPGGNIKKNMAGFPQGGNAMPDGGLTGFRPGENGLDMGGDSTFKEVGTYHDPYNKFKGLKDPSLDGGLIEAHLRKRGLAKMEELQENEEAARSYYAEQVKQIRELTAMRRENRVQPRTPPQTLDYLMDTEPDDFFFEISRVKPQLTPDFFNHLDQVISASRLLASDGDDNAEEMLETLESMKVVLVQATKAMDATAAEMAAAGLAVKRILQAGAGMDAEIEKLKEEKQLTPNVLDVLRMNAESARDAEQDEACKFLVSVYKKVEPFIDYTRPERDPADLPSAPVVREVDISKRLSKVAKQGKDVGGSGLIL